MINNTNNNIKQKIQSKTSNFQRGSELGPVLWLGDVCNTDMYAHDIVLSIVDKSLDIKQKHKFLPR